MLCLFESLKSVLRCAKCAVLLLSLGALAGCEVASVEPMGGVPVSIEAEDWEGLWVSDDGSNWGVIRVVNASGGELEIGFVDYNEERFWLATNAVYIRTAATDVAEEKAMFVSMSDEDPNLFIWGLLRKNDDHVEIQLPVKSRFRELVEKGTLPGRVEEGTIVTVMLEELTAEHLALISATDETLWKPSEPETTLRRYVSD